MWQKINKKSVFFFKGSVTVFALLLMFILAVTTIGIISTAAIERKVSISTGNSTTAFQIAESGMEKTSQYFKSNFDKTLNDINGAGNCLGGIVKYDANSMNTVRFINNADPPVYITNCGELISNVKIIKSIGTTKQETRAIEEDVFLGATKLLLHLNGTDDSGKFPDSSFYWNNHPITTTGGVSVESDDSDLIQLGEGSAKFDGTTGYLSVPDSNNWNFKTGDFTIDLWVRFSSIAGTQTLMERENSNLSLYYSGGYFYGIGSQFSWTPAINTWYHVALVRQGNALSMYVDGLPKGNLSNSTDISSASIAALYIGSTHDQAQFFNGYMDEIRISKGIARWTSSFSSRLPSAEYWAD